MSSQPTTNEILEPPQHRQLVRPWIWALMAIVLTLAVYLPALAGEFVWDDNSLIRQQTGDSLQHRFLDYFTKPFWGPSGVSPQLNLYYRPLVVLSYDIDRTIHGLNSAGFRITNFGFHATNVLLLFLLLRRLGNTGLCAALLSALWATLPRLSESVAWISGRTDVFATTAILAALLVWNERWSRLLVAALLLTLGLFCKETALAGVFAIATLELSQFRKRPWQSTFARVCCVAVPVLAWLTLKASVSGILPAGYGHQSTRTRILTVFEAIGRYSSMVLDWLRPRAEIGIMGEPDLPYAIFGMAVLVVVICFLVWLWPKLSNWPRALLIGVFAAIAPVLHVAQLTIDVNAADRFLYIPLALAVLTVGATVRLNSSRLAQVVCGLILLCSLPITFTRAKVWTDPLALWSAEYQKSAGSCRTCRRELTRIQADAGDFLPALHMLQTLIRDSMVRQNTPALAGLDMAVLFNKLGQHERALRLLSHLVKEHPGIPGFWRELAAAQAALYQFDAAEASAKQALKIMPSYESARSALSIIARLRRDVTKLNDATTSDYQRAQFYEACARRNDAEPIWLDLLNKRQSAVEVEAALDFVANLGSSTAVSIAGERHRELLAEFPYWALRIGEKHTLHQQLMSLRLVR